MAKKKTLDETIEKLKELELSEEELEAFAKKNLKKVKLFEIEKELLRREMHVIIDGCKDIMDSINNESTDKKEGDSRVEGLIEELFNNKDKIKVIQILLKDILVWLKS